MNSNDRAIVALVMVAHGMVHTYELSIPILMTVWLTELGTSEAVLGAVVGAGYLLFGAGALPGGILSDRYGSRPLIALCLAGMGASFLLLSFASTIWTLGAALILWGTAASVYHPAGLALISKGVKDRGEALAWHGIAGNVGIAFGPLITALLLLVLDWPWVAALLSVPAAFATAFAWTASFDEEAAVDDTDAPADEAHQAPKTSKASLGESASLRELWATSRELFATGFAIVFLLVMVSGLYYRGVLTFLPDLLTPLVTLDLPVDLETGRYVYAGILMVGILGQYAGGRMTDRLPTERVLVGAFVCLAAVAALFLPVAQMGTGALLGISAVLGFFLFFVQPLYQATVAEYTPAHARGLSYGFTYLGVFGVGALGAALAGSVLQYFSEAALFGTLTALAAIGLGLCVWLAVRPRRLVSDTRTR